MDIETVKSWALVLSSMLSIVSIIAVYMNSPGRKFEAALVKLGSLVETLEKQIVGNLKEHDRRIQAVESDVKHLPTDDEFSELQRSVTRLESESGHQGEMLRSVSRTVERIDDHLREKS